MSFKYTKARALAVCLLTLSLVACFNRPPELPEAPVISFNDIAFEVSTTMIGPVPIETFELKLTLNVSDGNGDIGLDGDENTGIYREFDFVRYNDPDQTIVQFGERPEDPPFTCVDWILEAPPGVPEDAVVDYNNDGDTNDTLRIIQNDNRHNIFIRFFEKQNDGSFVETDPRTWPPGSPNEETFCGISFNGRIPCLSSEDNPCNFVVNNDRPIEGTITYAMNSAAFLPVFRTNTIKLEFQIQDRALNRSNIAETPEFTLQDIRVDTN